MAQSALLHVSPIYNMAERGSVVANMSQWHVGDLSSKHAPNRWIWCKNMALNIGDCVSLVTRRTRLWRSRVNLGDERIVGDDIDHGRDRPQCQHRTVGLAIML